MTKRKATTPARQAAPSGPTRRPVKLPNGVTFYDDGTLPEDMMHRWVREGLTDAQIRRELEALGLTRSRQALGQWRTRHSYPASGASPWRERFIPWKVARHHKDHRYMLALRALVRHARGLPVSHRWDTAAQLVTTELREANAVIDYDPETGWRMVPARPGIDVDLIRDPHRRDDGSYYSDGA